MTVKELIHRIEAMGVRWDTTEVLIDGATAEGHAIKMVTQGVEIRGGEVTILALEPRR